MNFLKHLTKYQEGGQDVMGILQQFAQMQGLNQEQFKDMITKFQQLQPEEQQEALQQIQQAMQSSQSQSQEQSQQVDPNMQQQQMMQQEASQEPTEPMMQQGGFIPFTQYYKDAGLNMYQEGGRNNRVPFAPELDNSNLETDYIEPIQTLKPKPVVSQNTPVIPIQLNEVQTPVLTPKDVATIATTHNTSKDLQIDLYNKAKRLGLTDTDEFKKFINSSTYKKSRNSDNPEFDGIVGNNTKALAKLISDRIGDKQIMSSANKLAKTTSKFLVKDYTKPKDDPMKDPVNSIHSNEYIKPTISIESYRNPVTNTNYKLPDYPTKAKQMQKDNTSYNMKLNLDNNKNLPEVTISAKPKNEYHKVSNDNNYILQNINENRKYKYINPPFEYGYDEQGNVVRKVNNKNYPISKEEYDYLKTNGFKFN